ncbi:hypothetical protein HMSSN036_37880 [Paenibacillus macerans]|nr:hypothetical protein HMSSN036_37880 [Paenibacillus macerans]
MLTGLLLCAGCLRLPSFLYAMIPSLLVVCSLFYLHGQADGGIWFIDLGKQFGADLAEFMQTGRLSGASMEFRTLLLLIGWTLLVVSVQMLTLGRQNILLFLAVTLLYLIVLETAGGVELYLGLIRTAVLGLICRHWCSASGAGLRLRPGRPARLGDCLGLRSRCRAVELAASGAADPPGILAADCPEFVRVERRRADCSAGNGGGL